MSDVQVGARVHIAGDRLNVDPARRYDEIGSVVSVESSRLVLKVEDGTSLDTLPFYAVHRLDLSAGLVPRARLVVFGGLAGAAVGTAIALFTKAANVPVADPGPTNSTAAACQRDDTVMRPSSGHRYFAAAVAVITAAACHSRSAPSTEPAPCDSACVACAGEPYLAIDNQTSSAIEIYAYIDSGPPTYIGWVGETSTRMSLAGTPLEHRAGRVYARARGNAPPVPLRPGSSARDGTVALTRGCDKSRR